MRDTVIIGIACALAILLGAWLYLSGDNKTLSPAASAGEVTWEVLAEGNNSGSVTERANYRIKSTAELDELISMMYGTDGPALQPVDFEREEVLALFDGTHSSGGYAIRLESIEDSGIVRTVTLVHEEPGETCLTTGALSSPFLLVTVPRTSASLSKIERTVTIGCD